MGKDARIDDYIAKAAPFAQPLLCHLRALVHRAIPEIDETIKWGMPHFTLDGKNLAGMAAFKAHAAFMIHTEGRQGDAMGQFGKIAKLTDLPDEGILAAKLQTARERLASGTGKPRSARQPKPEIAMPSDLAEALSPAARSFFDGLSPSHRREYLEWITEAKRPETRAKRIADTAEWLAEGKKRNWKYEGC